MIKPWNEMPVFMKNSEVERYYNIVLKHKKMLVVKRCFDIVVSSVMFVILLPIILILSLLIVLDSGFPIFFRQRRVTKNGKVFLIYKFRTMVKNAENIGTQVTVHNDKRITRIGKILRVFKLDEVPQLINIFFGDMSFVGTRPEVEKYVEKYSDEMKATLLLPAGLTSYASIFYKDESDELKNAEDVDETYMKSILPEKMKYNLFYVMNFNLANDISIMIKTVFAVMGKKNKHFENKIENPDLTFSEKSN